MYPFGRRKYVIPSGLKPKKALSARDLELIKTYEPENERERKALDFWLFTYYSSGINMADICQLRWNDIDENGAYFTFIRQKTKHSTKSNSRFIRVYLRSEAWKVIERQGNPSCRNGYVFPFYNSAETPTDKVRACSYAVEIVNNSMKVIAQKLSIASPLTTYVARHSFGTTMLRKGTPLKMISDSYGHTSIVTTENYLALFEEDEVMKFANML
ncbi:hypothetical protein GCM10027299_42000 [Larkinella ripae]